MQPKVRLLNYLSVIKTPSTNFHAKLGQDYHGGIKKFHIVGIARMRLIDILDAQYEIVEFFEGWVDYMSGLGSTPLGRIQKTTSFL